MDFKLITLAASLTAALSACTVPNVDQATANYSPSTYSADLNSCRGGNIYIATLETVGVGVIGSLAGASIVALHGAVQANSGEAMVVAAIVGGTIGLGKGAYDAVKRHDEQLANCLTEKGYRMITPTKAS